MDTFKIGDNVKFKNPLSEFEKTAIFKITNINEGTQRILITYVSGSLPLLPIESEELVGIDTVEKI